MRRAIVLSLALTLFAPAARAQEGRAASETPYGVVSGLDVRYVRLAQPSLPVTTRYPFGAPTTEFPAGAPLKACFPDPNVAMEYTAIP